jgi:phosphoglycerate dehydrogenase-like enzyme
MSPPEPGTRRPRVAVLDDWQRVARDLADWRPLQARAEVVFFHEPLGGPDRVVAALADFDVILAMRERTAFPDEVLARLPRLRLFNITGRRARGLDLMRRRGIAVAVTGGGETGEDTAQHALALMLAAARRVAAGDAAIRGGGFQDGIAPGMALRGKTLGILGLGLIGGLVAGYGRALGMETVAWSRSMTPQKARAAAVEPVARDDLFRRAEVVSIHLVLSETTRGLVGARELALMRDGAILVNTSRGAIVDETALLAELGSGRLHAGLDVFAVEPLPAGHPLRRAPNAVLTPHLGYGTRETMTQFYRVSVANAVAFLDGAPLPGAPAPP